jgi:hypothetical protein
MLGIIITQGLMKGFSLKGGFLVVVLSCVLLADSFGVRGSNQWSRQKKPVSRKH